MRSDHLPPNGFQAPVRRSPPHEFSIAVARAMGTIIATVHGEIDNTSARRLDWILNDLIEGQENRRVVVDLRDVARVVPAAVTALAAAAGRAHQYGGTFTLNEPSDAVYESLEEAGMADVILAPDRDPRGSAQPHPALGGS